MRFGRLPESQTMLAFVMSEKHAFPWELPVQANEDGDPCCPHGVALHQDCHKCDESNGAARAAELGEPTLADTVRAIQQDIAFAVKHTAILVRSDNVAFRMVVNTERGQLMPPGRVTFSDGSTVEFQDVGMPQPNVPTMTVQELVKTAFSKATELGLEIA